MPGPDVMMYPTGFAPTAYTAELPVGGSATVTFQAGGADPAGSVYTYLPDEVTPYSLFGGTGNSYPVPTDRGVPLVIPKDTPVGVYVMSPTAVVHKGTKGSITVITGAM